MISTGNNTINGVTYNGGSAGQTDQNVFAYGFNNLQNGNNVATVVSYRPDGNDSIQRFTATSSPTSATLQPTAWASAISTKTATSTPPMFSPSIKTS